MSPLTKEDSRPHRAAVIIPGTVFYGNGTAAPALPGIEASLLLILEGTLDRFEAHSTIIVEGVAAVGRDSDELERVRLRGWKYSRADAWTLFRREDRTVAIGVRQALNPTRHLGVLFDQNTDPGVLAMLLDRYHTATGQPWRGTPAMSGINGIRATWENPRYEPLWKLPKECVRSSVGPLTWRRDLTGNELWWGYVHTFDANSAYLGSAISADLAWSRLHHAGPQMFDPALPGYWLLDLPNEILAMDRDPGRPPLLGRRQRDTCAWVVTPYAKMLMRFAQCDVIDSWTARAEVRESTGTRLHPAGSRILRGWGETIRDARIKAPASVEGAVKRTYSDVVGMLQSESSRIYRPDWAHTIIGLWRATLLQRVYDIYAQVGYWPVRITTDSISYADSNPDPGPLAQLIGAPPRQDQRRKLGRYRHTETLTTDQWLAKHQAKRAKAGAR